VPQRTPLEWLQFLFPLLNQQAKDCELFRAYYKGEHRLSYATAKFKEAFQDYFPPMADNWCQVVVDASVERIGIQGFRFGGLDQPADEEAWDIYQANNLDRESRILHTEAIKCGRAFLLVDPNFSPARITVESPLEVYVHRDPATGERLAAIKRWRGDDGHSYVTLYLPERVHKFRSRGKTRTLYGKPSFEEFQDLPEGLPNPLKVVPMIPVENNPDLVFGGVSDLEVIIPIQDRVNKLCLDLDVNSEFYAAPQRWATGWEVPRDENGQPLPAASHQQVAAAQTRFLAFDDPDTKVGQLQPGDPATFVRPIEMYVQHMAALSRTPPHYLLGKMANLSGDALKAAETGLVAKVMSKQQDFADPWEEALGLATGRQSEDAEVIWRYPESRTFGQLVDGAVKLHDSLSLPLEMSWEIIGLSPQQIKRAKRLLGLPDRATEEEIQDKLAEQAQARMPDIENGNDPQRDAGGNNGNGREAQAQNA
jgi:hypothetical protein